MPSVRFAEGAGDLNRHVRGAKLVEGAVLAEREVSVPPSTSSIAM